VVDEELRTPLEEVSQRGAPCVGVEVVVLVDPDPRQLLPSSRELVAAPGERFLLLEELEPGCAPLLPCPCRVLGHGALLRSLFGMGAAMV
jgi:hypothetical protein